MSKYKSEILCPVCKKVIDVHTYSEKDNNGFTTALLAQDARNLHKKESPSCSRHPDWMQGWIKTEPVEINDD